MALRVLMTKIVRHHIKYKEIHGEDVVIMMEWSEHQKLHYKLRREGKCKIPAETLHKFSQRANNVVNATRYNRNHRGKYLQYQKWYYHFVSPGNLLKIRPDIISLAMTPA